MQQPSLDQPSTEAGSATGFRMEPLYWLLPAVPLVIVLEYAHAPAMWVFLASCVAIIPLAGLMGQATECLAEALGSGIGGLLNATFGNAAELIIALVALTRNEVMLVKASITGSIIGNVLLVLGLSMLAGGLRWRKQLFNRTAASMGATLLALATFGLIVPTVYYHLLEADPHVRQALGDRNRPIELISEEIAALLALTYLLSLVFSLHTHRHLFAETEPTEAGHAVVAPWSLRTAVVVLAVSTALIAWISEFLVGSVEGARHALGMSEVFVGVIVVAVIGNAAEHSTAILMAMKNKMDLAVNIAVGSGIQIALFVAPVLVFASVLMNTQPPLDLHFTLMEVVSVVIAIVVVALVAQDGETHWMEGVMLLVVYVMIALAFYHLPGKL
ncbi:MAG: calcium/proton exchanger [Gemmataceae bacterium]|nr:calcium/proton exchanger [Gemmataceae bacterium]MDW8266419.1 calcium/proton exchanger [Gemmataceae bacterium]